jgi:hypothetical protein
MHKYSNRLFFMHVQIIVIEIGGVTPLCPRARAEASAQASSTRMEPVRTRKKHKRLRQQPSSLRVNLWYRRVSIAVFQFEMNGRQENNA